ncbi:MAG: porin [Oceanospirillales bacterium]|nr:porin [Oceanospirillales bacterium]MBR9886203.1 porin [Oceanospirillales bacterium]
MKKLIPALALAVTAGQVQALTLQAGDWTLGVSGNVNSHAVFAECDDSGNQVDANALLCTGENASSVSNGYIPASIMWTVATQQQGYDISANIALEPGLTTNAAFNGQDDDQAIRAFLLAKKEGMGTIKAGRDYGVFALDVILADMSLIGVGAHGLVKSPLNTSFGSVGYGYIFTDRISQISFATPLGDSAEATIGVFQPLDLITLGAGVSTTGDSGSSLPGVHGKLRFNSENGFVSASFLSQTVKAGSADYTSHAVDLTASYAFNDLGVVASCFTADGVGTAGLFIDAADVNGEARRSKGCFGQLTYQNDATKYGISLGQTRLDKTAADPDTLMKSQTKATIGAYHNLTDNLLMIAEYSRFNAKNHLDDELENSSVNLGLAFFF